MGNFTFFVTIASISSLTQRLFLSGQRADQQAAVADRPALRVPEGPGGGEEEPPGAAVLALPAQQGGGRAGAVDRPEGGGRQLARTGSRL